MVHTLSTDRLPARARLLARASVLACALAFSPLAAAQSAALPKVDGQALSQAQFDALLQAARARGQADTPQLRAAITEELVTRQVLVREAAKTGLERDTELAQQLAALRENLLIDRLIARQVKPDAITDAELRAEYDRQIATLGADAREYRMSLLLARDEAGAREMQAELQRGAAWDAVAREKSIDPSREQGGNLGWMLPQALMPAIASVMVNLKAGSVSAAPIATPQGWALIRVDDTRPFKAPSFDEARPRVLEAVFQRKRQEFVARLRQSAKVTP